MRVALILLVLCVCCFYRSAAGEIDADSDDAEYIEDIRLKLAREAEKLSKVGFRPAREFSKLVGRRGVETLSLHLDIITNYALVAACDKDCTHVALALRDGGRRHVAASADRHHTVVVHAAMDSGGNHFAELSAPGCKEEECYVGLLVLYQGDLPDAETKPFLRVPTPTPSTP